MIVSLRGFVISIRCSLIRSCELTKLGTRSRVRRELIRSRKDLGLNHFVMDWSEAVVIIKKKYSHVVNNLQGDFKR